jgi:hypothetical protein
VEVEDESDEPTRYQPQPTKRGAKEAEKLGSSDAKTVKDATTIPPLHLHLLATTSPLGARRPERYYPVRLPSWSTNQPTTTTKRLSANNQNEGRKRWIDGCVDDFEVLSDFLIFFLLRPTCVCVGIFLVARKK